MFWSVVSRNNLKCRKRSYLLPTEPTDTHRLGVARQRGLDGQERATVRFRRVVGQERAHQRRRHVHAALRQGVQVYKGPGGRVAPPVPATGQLVQ